MYLSGGKNRRTSGGALSSHSSGDSTLLFAEIACWRRVSAVKCQGGFEVFWMAPWSCLGTNGMSLSLSMRGESLQHPKTALESRDPSIESNSDL